MFRLTHPMEHGVVKNWADMEKVPTYAEPQPTDARTTTPIVVLGRNTRTSRSTKDDAETKSPAAAAAAAALGGAR